MRVKTSQLQSLTKHNGLVIILFLCTFCSSKSMKKLELGLRCICLQCFLGVLWNKQSF